MNKIIKKIEFNVKQFFNLFVFKLKVRSIHTHRQSFHLLLILSYRNCTAGGTMSLSSLTNREVSKMITCFHKLNSVMYSTSK